MNTNQIQIVGELVQHIFGADNLLVEDTDTEQAVNHIARYLLLQFELAQVSAFNCN